MVVKLYIIDIEYGEYFNETVIGTYKVKEGIMKIKCRYMWSKYNTIIPRKRILLFFKTKPKFIPGWSKHEEDMLIPLHNVIKIRLMNKEQIKILNSSIKK